MLSSFALLIFPAAMAFAAAMDMLTMTIPNRISLALVGSFAIAAPFSGLSFETFAMHLASGALMLLVGIGMFARGWVGGGDAKLIAAGALWVGLSNLFPYLLLIGLCGSLLMTLIVVYRAYPAAALPLPGWAIRLHHVETGLPYGLAIGAAGLLVFPHSPIFAALAQ